MNIFIIYHYQCSHITNSISSDLFHLYVIGVRERSREKCLVSQAVWLHDICAAFNPTHTWCHLGKCASGQLKQSRNIQRQKSPISSSSTFPLLELPGMRHEFNTRRSGETIISFRPRSSVTHAQGNLFNKGEGDKKRVPSRQLCFQSKKESSKCP